MKENHGSGQKHSKQMCVFGIFMDFHSIFEASGLIGISDPQSIKSSGREKAADLRWGTAMESLITSSCFQTISKEYF